MKKLGNLLSKNDAVYLLELIYESLSCNNEEELRKLILKLKYSIPFEFALCGFGKISSDYQANSYNIINISYPSEWLELYVSQRFDKIDPVVKENFTTCRVQYWNETYKKHNPPKEFIHSAEDFGLERGYSHGILDNGRKGSLFSFSGDSIERHPRTETILEYIIPHLHQCLTRISGQNNVRHKVALSPREKEILKWLKNGKTSWEISVILSISQDTIKFHVKRIMQKLDAVKRTQAVAIAIEHGLIDID